MQTDFLNIWLAQKSWAPIVLTHPKGWQTIKNPKGKAIPLSASHLTRAYDQHGDIIGKRFGRFTNYLMVDIDTASQYHPARQGPQPVLDALEDIGLVEHIKVRSSASQGIHIYFPLDAPMKSWELAKRAHDVLTSAGVVIANGTCELFPNKKSWVLTKTEYNGHRLPLQNGSFMLDDEWGPVTNEQDSFARQWALVARRNACHDADEVERDSVGAAKLPPLPKFTGPCQSNEIVKHLANYGDKHLGLKTVPELSAWMKKTIVELPGYSQHASQSSKDDIEKGWCTRWAKSHFRSSRRHEAKKQGPNHNQVVAENALSRLKACLKHIGAQHYQSARKAWEAIREAGLRLFGVGIGWTTFVKLRKLWAHLTETPGQAAHTVSNKEGMCSHTEQGAQLAHTPSKLSPGDRVKVVLPGCPDDGKVTTIKSKHRDNCDRRVYRLAVRLAGRFLELPAECLSIV